ncbi:hypothetical protein IE53DRAFT_388793 [Violaceomyces palustris]|uniref:Uncharacterized protein n=1 Tax=Violaceomyces palustris TaxID=1673888 RepID=A0ACD0NT67_9BASI|nr:hypothetical protein IE53DRAFT_388793 [Violaceomyces palustris]
MTRTNKLLRALSSSLSSDHQDDSESSLEPIERFSSGSDRIGGQIDSSVSRDSSLPGGTKAIFAFLLSLLAYTFQTELAQYVQQTLAYRKPFLSLYLGHSGFTLILPFHLLFLHLTTSLPLSHHLDLLYRNLDWQLSNLSSRSRSGPRYSLLPRPTTESIASGRLIPSNSFSNLGDGQGRVGNDPSTSTEIDLEHQEPPSILTDETLTRPKSPRRSSPSQNGERGGGTMEKKSFLDLDVARLVGLLCLLTLGMTVPALSWYSAVPMTSMADITAIYNTFSIWALVFSVWFLGERWERKRVFSVLLASVGVFVVAYGGGGGKGAKGEGEKVEQKLVQTSSSSSNPALGNLLAFVGAVTMAAYEMIFKLVGTLPDEAAQAEQFSHQEGGEEGRRHRGDASQQQEVERLSRSDDFDADDSRHEGPSHRISEPGVGGGAAKETDDHVGGEGEEGTRGSEADERVSIWNGRRPQPVGDEAFTSDYRTMTPPDGGSNLDLPGIGSGRGSKREKEKVKVEMMRMRMLAQCRVESEEVQGRVLKGREGGRRASGWNEDQDQTSRIIPPPLPFGLHANMMTSGIGAITLCLLWIGIPIADALGWEKFEAPRDLWTASCVLSVVLCGVLFNAAFMILLSLWGPVMASVSCLTTTVLVEAADVIVLGRELKAASVIGCTLIAAGFGVLIRGGGGVH